MGKTNEFEGATCTACDSPLNRNGFCTNRRCGYSTCYQDEPGGWLRNQQVRVQALKKYQEGCVVANKQSGRYHRVDDPAYRRAKKARHVEFFQTENDAQAAGYRRAAP